MNAVNKTENALDYSRCLLNVLKLFETPFLVFAKICRILSVPTINRRISVYACIISYLMVAKAVAGTELCAIQVGFEQRFVGSAVV
jgi:hypothetical protein